MSIQEEVSFLRVKAQIALTSRSCHPKAHSSTRVIGAHVLGTLMPACDGQLEISSPRHWHLNQCPATTVWDFRQEASRTGPFASSTEEPPRVSRTRPQWPLEGDRESFCRTAVLSHPNSDKQSKGWRSICRDTLK